MTHKQRQSSAETTLYTVDADEPPAGSSAELPIAVGCTRRASLFVDEGELRDMQSPLFVLKSRR